MHEPTQLCLSDAIRCLTVCRPHRFGAAIEAKPQSEVLLALRSEANLKRGAAFRGDALQDAAASIKRNPQYLIGYLRKAEALHAIGKSDDALRVLEIASAAEGAATSQDLVELKQAIEREVSSMAPLQLKATKLPALDEADAAADGSVGHTNLSLRVKDGHLTLAVRPLT